jgi:hypothetical protein
MFGLLIDRAVGRSIDLLFKLRLRLSLPEVIYAVSMCCTDQPNPTWKIWTGLGLGLGLISVLYLILSNRTTLDGDKPGYLSEDTPCSHDYQVGLLYAVIHLTLVSRRSHHADGKPLHSGLFSDRLDVIIHKW